MNRKPALLHLARRALALGVCVLGTAGALTASAHTSRGGVLMAALSSQVQTRGQGDADAAELARLRAELSRLNGEIDALKRSDRNVRDEARLRARLADAEALARRLTEAERRAGSTAPSAPVLAGVRVQASPQDSPSDLDAKADILDDRARRVGVAAAQLETRLRAFQTRQELKRRAGQLDQDPFAAFEVSKRHVVSSAGISSPTVNGAVQTNDRNAGESTKGGTTAAPGPTAGSTPVGSPGLTGGAGDSRGPSTAVVLPPPAGVETSSSISLQFRDALDPTTLADIRRLEASGPGGRGLALQRALAALTAEQQTLGAQARALRAQARGQSSAPPPPSTP